MEQIIYSIATYVAILFFAVILFCYYNTKKYPAKSKVFYLARAIGLMLTPTIIMVLAEIIFDKGIMYWDRLNLLQASCAGIVMLIYIIRVIMIDRLYTTKYNELKKCCFLYDFNNYMKLNKGKLALLLSPMIIVETVILGIYISSALVGFSGDMTFSSILTIVFGAAVIIGFMVWVIYLLVNYAKS